MTRAASWSADELAVLADVYPREGVVGAAAALPARTPRAIEQRAFKAGLKSPIVGDAPSLKLESDRLEQAIRWHEQGRTFVSIARELGIGPTAVTNAILITLCPRRGYRPAERDATGRMTDESKERLRYMLKKGIKGVEIQLRLGLSAARVAEERRRYQRDLAARDKAPLPPPGGGTQYCGVPIPAAKRKAVEALLLDGFGSTTAARRTGVSIPSAKNIRTRLVARLARKKQALPGCDLTGKRTAGAKESIHYIPEAAIAELHRRLLNGEPVAPASKACGIGLCGAYRIRDRLAADLAAHGAALPKPIRMGRGSARRAAERGDDWLPEDRRHQFRELCHKHGFDEAKQLVIAEVEAQRLADVAARAAERARPKTFEEQLARVASGQARAVTKIVLRRPDPSMTLGGVASGAL